MVGIDFLELTETKKKNRYILTITDLFSKFPDAVALPNKTAATTADALIRFFFRYGFPEIVLSDNGGEFVNEVNRCKFF